MTSKTLSTFLLIIFNIILINQSFAKEDSIFLCIDSMLAIKTTTGKDPLKLVYSYIDGKKTPCMSEQELRSLLSETSFKQTDLELQQKQQRTFQQNAVFRGEKNLRNADLRGMDLQGLDLSGADLSGALLESVDLRNAKLINAKLTGASLKNSYCKNTNFNGADFTNAKLNGTFFQHADLTNTEGLQVENLSLTATLYKSKFDASLMEVLDENLSSKLVAPNGTWAPVLFTTTPSKD